MTTIPNTQFADIQIADALRVPASAIRTTAEEWFPLPFACTVDVHGRTLDCYFDAIGLHLILDARNGELTWKRREVGQ